MASKRNKRKPYYGKKGGAATYKNPIIFDVRTTLKALKDYYHGKATDEKAS